MTEQPQVKVAIHGYYGFRNVGDEAILAVILENLRREIPQVEPVVISGDPRWTKRIHGVQAVDSHNLARVAACIRKSSLVISGGGGLLQDYGTRDSAEVLAFPALAGMPSYAQVPLLAKVYGKPLVLLAHGVGPIRTIDGALLARFVFGLADRVTVRDDLSRSVVEALHCVNGSVTVAPDPAFAFPIPSRESSREKVAQVLGSRWADNRPVIGVSVRWWEEAAGWPQNVAKALDLLLERTNALLLFIPFQDSDQWSDSAQARRIVKAMRHKNRCFFWKGHLRPEEIAAVIGGCDTIIAMRLHAAILAIRAGVPVVALAYDPKVRETMRQAGQEEYTFDLADLKVEEVADKVEEVLDSRPSISRQLQEVAERLAGETHRHFEGLAELAQKGDELEADFISAAPPPPADYYSGLSRLYTEVDALRQGMTQRDRETRERDETMRAQQTEMAGKDEAMHALRGQLEEIVKKVMVAEGEFRAYEQDKEAYVAALRAQLRVARKLSLFPALSLAVRAGRKALRLSKDLLRRYLPRRWTAFYGALRHSGVPYDDTGQLTVYYEKAIVFPGYPRRIPLSERPDVARKPVSLVATVRTEGASVRTWIESLLNQTRHPDEVIIVDGGSTDETVAELREFARTAPFPVKVISAGNVNIARGRNIGIAQATHPFIACTDFGCELDHRWLEYLAAPFEIDPDTMVVAGWHEPTAHTTLGKAAALQGAPNFMDPQSFLPSSRSVAFTKQAWAAVGGYPDWLTPTGEDTYFSLELKRCCNRWALVPEARVYWRAPDGLSEGVSTAYRSSIGDGEAGLFPNRYWHSLTRSVLELSVLMAAAVGLGLAFVIPWLALIPTLAVLWFAWRTVRAARARRRMIVDRTTVTPGLATLSALIAPLLQWSSILGFLRGVRNRPRALERRIGDVNGVAFILSGVPISDSGGGQRPAQLALGFLRQKHLVVYINLWESYETVDLKIRVSDPRLLTYPAHAFDMATFMEEHGEYLKGKPMLAVLEHPVIDFLRIGQSMRAAGVTVVYDLLDDWATSLGADFYSPEVEKEIIDTSHVLVATAQPLKRRLERSSGRTVALIPNAVNTHIFNTEGTYLRPADLPPGDFVICYIGALWGEWFDWSLLRKVAVSYPNATVAVIGDYRGLCPAPPPNLHFLGLKPQSQLPAYLAHCDVAIIPWVIGKITEAVSPLKLYEYLAMGKPVVAPRIGELEGIPYVMLSETDAEFIANVEAARQMQIDQKVIEKFVQENSWAQRVTTLLELASRNGSRQSDRSSGLSAVNAAQER